MSACLWLAVAGVVHTKLASIKCDYVDLVSASAVDVKLAYAKTTVHQLGT